MNEKINQDGLLALYNYNIYANRLVLDTIEKLTPEEFTRECSPSHGSVQGLITHMLGCEAGFLARCRGQAIDWDAIDLSTLPAIRGYWRQLEQDQLAFIGALSESDLTRSLSMQPAGQLLVFPLWQMLVQAVVHSIHHRGELSIVLTQLGYPLPTLDIILHFTQQSGQTWPQA
jgi:uncharacterized damage-inducible protein DinB